MNEALRVVKNTVVMSTGRIWMSLGAAVFTIVLARYLGVASFGVYIFLTTLWDLFRGLVASGLSVLLVREVAQDHEKTSLYLSNSLVMMFLFTLLAGAGVYIMAKSDPNTANATQASFVIALALFPATAVVVYESLLIAYERMEFITVMTVIETIIRVGLSFLLLWRGVALEGLLAAIIVSQTVMLIGYHVLFTSRLHSLEWRPDWHFARTLVHDSTVLTVQNGLATLSSRLGIVVLTFLSGSVAVGLFAAAGKLTRVSLFIDSYRDAIFPNMSRLTTAPDQGFRQVLEKSFKYLTIAFLPFVIGTTVLADRLIVLLYSSEYAGAIILVQVMVWGLLLKVFVPLLSRALIALGRQDLSLRVTTVSLVLGMILTILLIPPMGPVGLLLAGYISDGVGLAMLHHFLTERKVHIRYMQILIRPSIAGAAMGVIAVLMHDLSLLVVVPVCAGVYGLGLIVLQVFTPRERDLMQQTWRAAVVRAERILSVGLRARQL